MQLRTKEERGLDGRLYKFVLSEVDFADLPHPTENRYLDAMLIIGTIDFSKTTGEIVFKPIDVDEEMNLSEVRQLFHLMDEGIGTCDAETVEGDSYFGNTPDVCGVVECGLPARHLREFTRIGKSYTSCEHHLNDLKAAKIRADRDPWVDQDGKE